MTSISADDDKDDIQDDETQDHPKLYIDANQDGKTIETKEKHSGKKKKGKKKKEHSMLYLVNENNSDEHKNHKSKRANYKSCVVYRKDADLKEKKTEKEVKKHSMLDLILTNKLKEESDRKVDSDGSTIV